MCEIHSSATKRYQQAYVSSALKAVLQHRGQTVHQFRKHISQTSSPIAANDAFHYVSRAAGSKSLTDVLLVDAYSLGMSL